MFDSSSVPLPIPQTFTRKASSEPPKKLIVLAWMIEGVAVSVSASLAAYPLIGAGEGTAIEKWLMAAPFLVIAFAELAKIPAVEAMLRLKGMVPPCIAAFAALLICLNTFYTCRTASSERRRRGPAKSQRFSEKSLTSSGRSFLAIAILRGCDPKRSR